LEHLLLLTSVELAKVLTGLAGQNYEPLFVG